MEATTNPPLAERFVQGLKEPATLRLLLVAAVVGASTWMVYQARAGLKPPAVDMPDRDYHNLPYELGDWRGVDKELDPEIFKAIGANYVVDRIYRNGPHRISLHLAVFDNPDEGVRHSPMNCYLGQGFREISTKSVSLGLADQPDMRMLATTWEKEQKRVLVGYWFKLGDHLLFDRTDMFRVRMQLRGQSVWPALVKVLVHYEPQGASPTEDDVDRAREFAATVEKWIAAPDDQTARRLIGARSASTPAAEGIAPAVPDNARPANGKGPAAGDKEARRAIPPAGGARARNFV